MFELHMPITFPPGFLVLTASIAFSALNYNGYARVPHIISLLMCPVMLVSHEIWTEAEKWYLKRQLKELKAKAIVLRTGLEELNEIWNGMDEEDEEDEGMMALLRADKARVWQEAEKLVETLD